MTKNIIKELIIILLLVLAIILLLGVILYDYVPSNKIVPEKVSYSPPEDLKQELEDTIDESVNQNPQTYKIEAEDLNNYKKIQEYVPGRKNPFASTTNTETTNNSVSNDVNGTNQKTESSNTNEELPKTQSNVTSNESTGYIPDKGTK